MARAKLPSILSYLLNAFSESIMIFFLNQHTIYKYMRGMEKYGEKKNMISIFKVA